MIDDQVGYKEFMKQYGRRVSLPSEKDLGLFDTLNVLKNENVEQENLRVLAKFLFFYQSFWIFIPLE